MAWTGSGENFRCRCVAFGLTSNSEGLSSEPLKSDNRTQRKCFVPARQRNRISNHPIIRAGSVGE
jgi:hypothetical protein